MANPEEFRVQESKELAIKLLKLISSLKQDWKNGVPNDVLHSTSPDAKYKVRKAWFDLVVGVLDDVQSATFDGLLKISSTLIDEIEEYEASITTDEFSSRLTTAEDIKQAEAIIDKVAVELNNKI